ncbi:D-glycero-alpha-D-manno-heptose-1,7-bisphosphate 7-phosphatase [Thermocoleostomius sinensis]|uniref:D,D-heptose 1,7-bisphosphate phosphatase n=1 Tax=Thermocoleostomius sinensis A174 TaxID=2016057 RepID=A0A9E9CB27_9CYAN|nr:HAD family hydrolase [Thermocoleostomius sinensis]WAL61742.1 HAD family hydrolase [Thermocoleostomius sinensis A174]
MSQSAVFLDKDGTLIENVPYNVDITRIRLCSGVLAGLSLLSKANYPLFVISNQSGIARGYFSEADLIAVEDCLQSQLAPSEVALNGFYYCPHLPDGCISAYAIECDCRKPRPGLLQQAARDHAIDLSCSWFVGDILHDVEAGRAAGCRTILIDNGNETEWHLSPARLPHHIVADFAEAAQIILTIDRIHNSMKQIHPIDSLSTSLNIL